MTNSTTTQTPEQIREDKLNAVFASLHTSASMGPAAAPNWLVDGLIEKNKLATAFGPSGSCKSFVAIDAGMSVATGKDFHGKETGKGDVVYICGEGREGINNRMKAWESERNEGKNVEGFFMTPTPIMMNTDEGIQYAKDIVDSIKMLRGEFPKLIIIDTLDRNFEGDENSSAAMSSFVSALTDIRVHTEACVMVIHHTGKSGDAARGSSVLRAGMDTEILIKKDDRQNIVIENTKMKDAEDGGKMILSTKVVKVGKDEKKNKDITSLVLCSNEKQTKIVKKVQSTLVDNNKTVRRGKNQTIILEEIFRLADKSMTVDSKKVLSVVDMQAKAAKRSLTLLEENGDISMDGTTIRINHPM